MLYGPSGVGKSSLLRAGVVRRLRALVRPEPVGTATALCRWSSTSGATTHSRRSPRLQERACPSGPRSSPTCSRSASPRWTASSISCSTRWRSTSSTTAARAAGRCGRRSPRSSADRRSGCTCCSASATMRSPSWTRSRGGCPGLFGNVLRLDHLDVDSARAAILEPLAELEALGGPRVEAEPALVAAVVDQVASGRIERRLAGRGIVDGAAKTRPRRGPVSPAGDGSALGGGARAGIGRAASRDARGARRVGPDRAAAPRARAGRARCAGARARSRGSSTSS